MVKRLVSELAGAVVLTTPGLNDAPVLDLMCSHFVLTLAARRGSSFNVRRDLNSVVALAGRHLVWPAPVLMRLRDFLLRRCGNNEYWRGHEALSNAEFLSRYGVWRGPYEEGTLFFYLDEYAKDQPKDLISLLAVTGEWLTHALKKQSTLVEKNIDSLAGLLQLNKAERALLLYGTLARYQRDLRSILVEFKVNNAPEAYAAIAELAGVNANDVGEALRAGSRLERIGLIENLISEHNITDLADLMKVSEKLPPVLMREYRDQAELMAVFTRPSSKSALSPTDFSFVQDDTQVLCALLGNAVARKESGVNVLLYGPPGTGKTELAKVVAQAAGLELFEVEYADRDGNSLAGATAIARCRSPRCSSRAARRQPCCSTRSRTCSRQSRAKPRRCLRAPSRSRHRRTAASVARRGSTRFSNRTPSPRSGSPTASNRSTRPSAVGSPTTSNSSRPPPALAKRWYARRWLACR